MKTEQEYIKDLSQIRAMMERSTKFLSLTGWSGIMAGIYALLGAYVVYHQFYLNLTELKNSVKVLPIAGMAVLVMVLALGTAGFLSFRKAKRNGELFWNPTAKRLVINLCIPLLCGGLLIMVFITKGLFEFLAPLSLLFYGLALINASKFTFYELRSLGLIEISLGLIGTYYTELGLLIWATGFGIMHIAYGIFMHLKFEK